MSEKAKSVFDILNAVDVGDKIEKKNGLSYLSWAWAWSTTKKLFPNAFYTVYENKDGFNYHHDNKTAWVKTGVTIEGQEYIEYLPIMDFKNKSVLLTALTSFDVNKAIQRSLTKAIARHGLGLYIYAGEDLPEDGKTIGAEPKQVKNFLEEAKVTELRALMKETETEEAKFLAFCKAKNIWELDFEKAQAALNAKKSKLEQAKDK